MSDVTSRKYIKTNSGIPTVKAKVTGRPSGDIARIIRPATVKNERTKFLVGMATTGVLRGFHFKSDKSSLILPLTLNLANKAKLMSTIS